MAKFLGTKISQPVGYGALFVLLGLVLALGAIAIGAVHSPEATSFLGVALALFSAVGLTLMTAGIFSVLLQAQDWKNYFQEALRTIVVTQEHLAQLSPEELVNLQITTLKLLHKTSDIDREGSFLRYFQDNMQKFMSDPYREDVRTELVITEVMKDTFKVSDTISYNCRMVGGAIQPDIRYVPDPGELTLHKLSISVVVPAGHRGSEKSREVSLEEMEQEGHGEGSRLDLSDFARVDHLKVVIKSVYEVPRNRFQYWQMAHPTKTFNFTLQYPGDKLELQHKPLVLHPDQCQTNEEEGFFSLHYDSWMLPLNGLVWRLHEKKATSRNRKRSATSTKVSKKALPK